MATIRDACFTTGGRPILLVLGASVFGLAFLVAAWRRAELTGFDARAAAFCLFGCIVI